MGSCDTYRGEKKCIQRLLKKSEGKRLPGRQRCGCENIIKMGLVEINGRART